MRNLILSAILLVFPAAARAQTPVTLTLGYRGPTAYRNQIKAGPLFGVAVQPIQWKWGRLGLELSLAPRITQRDSGAYFPPGQGCYGPDGVLTTCGSIRTASGERTIQLGAVTTLGPRNRRVAPFGELALGYYGTRQMDQVDIWDTSGRPLTNLSLRSDVNDAGVYVRVGAGVEFKPWSRGPALSVGARYRWAKAGIGIDDWTEWFNDRKGVEIVAAVRF